MLYATVSFAEGSKQLTPNQSSAALTDPANDKAGYLAHDANFPSASGVAITSLSFLKPAGFSRNGATYSKDHRLYIRVKAGETLYYGVRRAIHEQTTANQADLIITLRRINAVTGTDDDTYSTSTTLIRNTNSTRGMLLSNTIGNGKDAIAQSGVIQTPAQALTGPNRPALGGKAAVTSGYAPLTITNNTGVDYDYYVEFSQVGEANMTDDGQRFSVYDLWDFTVIDAAGDERQGRMRSKLWSFSAGGTTNVFSKDFNMYPLIPSEDHANKYFVKKIELAGIAPQNFFRFVTNRFGSSTAAGSSIADRRKSQTSQTDYPELFNFVNNPDPALWPSADAPTFTVGVASSCNTSTNGGKSTFSLNTSESSTFIVLINLNGVAGYQPGSADVLLESTGAKGNRTVEWNGLNGLGQVVAKNTTLNYFFRNNSSPVHFPVWDAEANADGFRVQDVRPLVGSNYDGLLFWDDSNLPTSSFPAPQTEFYGVSSSSGVHRWGSASTTAGDLKTVNTWTYGYTGSSTQTAAFDYDCSADVAVTNTAATAPYTIGKPFTYTVTVTNNGPIAASNVQVTDKLDLTKLEFVSSSEAASYVSSTGVWTVGSLAVGASKTLTITAKPLVLGTISTTASQTHTEADNVTTNNSATASITVQAAADIEVKNTSDKTTYNNGDLVTYTITAKNLGPNAATGVTVTDKLPTGLTLEGTAPAGYDAATGNWTVGALALNETKTLTLMARTSALGSFTNTAALASRTGFELDENNSNNTSSNTITVSPTADVAVTNVVSTNTPSQNEVVTYTIKVVNNGPNNASTVTVANQLPAGLEITGSSVSLGSFDKITGIWTIGTIANAGSQTLMVYAKAANTGSYTITSTQSHTEFDNQSTNNSSSGTITVQPLADVAVTQIVTPSAGATYTTGETVTYTVNVTNNGPSTATNVLVTDKLPASLTFISATSGMNYNAATGLWTVGTLASGATTTLQITASINQSAVITTTASQTHKEADNVLGNNSASATIQSGTGVITADIAVTVSTPGSEYYTGNTVPVTIVVTNSGPDAATNIKINTPIPAGFSVSSIDPRVGTYANGVWNIPTLAAGASTRLFITGSPTADPATSGDKTYAFSAAVTGTPEQFDNVSNNNSSNTSIIVHKAADAGVVMQVTGGDANGNFYRGITEATFTLRVTNHGPDVITNLVGSDTKTGTLNFTYFDQGKGYNPETGIWNIGTLGVNESVSLVVKGIPNTTGRLNLGGNAVTMDQYDANSENNKAIALLNVLPVAELAVTNTASAATYSNGQTATFTVKVQNNGPDAATGVVVEDKLPAGLTFVNAVASSGAYDPGTGRWTLGSDVLAGEANAQILVITARPMTAATFTTTAAIVASGQYDNIANNNSQAASIQVSASGDIALSSTIAEGPYYVGGQYLVTITTTNLGPDAATGVVVAAGVAPGLSLVPGSGRADDGTTIDPANGLWTIGTLGVNETKNLTLLVQPTALGVLNSIGYKYATNEFDPNGGNTKDGNNTTLVYITAVDREATSTVVTTGQHMFRLQTGQVIASISDPDGAIDNARIINGTLPAGVRLQKNGVLEVDYRYALVPGSYTLTIETVDAIGGISENTLTYSISGDWDGDGIADKDDLDANNDGVLADAIDAGYAPFGDNDGDGIPNYLDKDLVHTLYGAFRDKNHDDINDVFDLDLDGLIRGYDIDKDGDGIPNAVEANGGKIPTQDGYDAAQGIFTGPVSANGMPIAVQTSSNSGISTLPNPDTDGDGFTDQTDLDSDNDGILDNREAQSTKAYVNGLGTDSDYDGLSDGYDATTSGTAIIPIDTDKDGTPDYLDRNSDGDIALDYVEAFDDNHDGVSMDDLMERARVFEESNAKGYYVNSDQDATGTPNWLKLTNGYPAFLTKGNTYYHDSDFDGLVDLFDIDNGGKATSLQAGTNGEYAFRNAEVVTPLPVTLISFTGKALKEGVLLNWATASEKDNSYFQVERSADGKTFTAIGKVTGAGTSSVRLDYRFLDAKTVPSTVYYRLKQVDYDGKFEYSKVVAVQIKATAAGVTVKAYPNPTTGVLNLDLASMASSPVTVKVYALDGRLIKTAQVMGGAVQTLNLSTLAAGTYLVKIAGEHLDTTVRIVKN
ncbi:hypothetical protein TH63_00485 [Rufibacter radiotolerans]|uniref:DUF11 domain-containing protein n=1 Tax=Rufibacter radiotolerans TaxID=1379910 RepID=A0A0H4VKP3_9BACT|nr:T9SS type A sorting domain-containing protein [Rufibacter radiotolerans]AKQ44457.1 hypothetical protein TH63_00485 [Rufibacter radiotolerans]